MTSFTACIAFQQDSSEGAKIVHRLLAGFTDAAAWNSLTLFTVMKNCQENNWQMKKGFS